jgi:hypothetical protein
MTMTVEKSRAKDWIRLYALSNSELAEESLFAHYAQNGLSCIPVATDGSKKTLVTWKHSFQQRIPKRSDVINFHRNFGTSIGIAVITGVVSGGTEGIDFDDGSLFPEWYQMVESIACKLPIIETPSYGYHIYYRSEVVSGNHKIAMDPKREKSTLIETRGEGGYLLAVGSPGKCHPTGRPYVQVQGPVFPEIPYITTEERKALWAAARTFDKREPHQEFVDHRLKQLRREARPVRPDAIDGQKTPWDDFDDRGDWSAILEPFGWTSFDGVFWKRPGKTDSGFSAKINISESGQDVLTVYSSNAGPLAPTNGFKSFGKSTAYALLNHGGDHKESGRALRKQGYGGRSR